MDSPQATARAVGCPIRTSEDHRALAPPLGFSQRATSFIASRYQGIHQMPFLCCARAQPQARASGSSSPQAGSPQNARVHKAARRGQRADRDAACRLLIAAFGTAAQTAAPCRCSRTGSTHTHAPGPTSLLLRGDGRTCFTVTTRFTMSTEQRTENRRQTRRSVPPVLRHNSRFPTPEDASRDFLSVFCLLSSGICTWWAWAELNGRPHAYQACALTN
jgi:hypothetical protein